MLALKDKCIHPQTKKPYIRSASGGINTSPEGYDVRCLALSLALFCHCHMCKEVQVLMAALIEGHHAHFRQRI
jgi:hypothetical protein